MRKSVLARFAVLIGPIAVTSIPLGFVSAHEGHQIECSEMRMNALTADIQAMPDGEPKTTAMKEMQMAEDMMAKHDMEGCKTHMHNATEATEK